MADTHKLGIDGLLLVGAAGSTPTVALGDETEVTLTVTNNFAKYATRGQPRMNARPTTQELSMNFTVIKDFDDASFKLLHAAAVAQTAIAIKALDTASTGYGWDADWYVSVKEGQPLDGFNTCEFECAFTSDNRALTEINPA